MKCQLELFHVAHALDPWRFGLGLGQRGQKQRGQDGNDGDDHQQLDECEAPQSAVECA